MSYSRPSDCSPSPSDIGTVDTPHEWFGLDSSLAQETTGQWIGPFPAQDFVNLLSGPVDTIPEDAGDIFGDIPCEDDALEVTLYKTLVSRRVTFQQGAF